MTPPELEATREGRQQIDTARTGLWFTTHRFYLYLSNYFFSFHKRRRVWSELLFNIRFPNFVDVFPRARGECWIASERTDSSGKKNCPSVSGTCSVSQVNSTMFDPSACRFADYDTYICSYGKAPSTRPIDTMGEAYLAGHHVATRVRRYEAIPAHILSTYTTHFTRLALQVRLASPRQMINTTRRGIIRRFCFIVSGPAFEYVGTIWQLCTHSPRVIASCCVTPRWLIKQRRKQI